MLVDSFGQDEISGVQKRLMGEGRRVLALAMETSGSMQEKNMVFLGLLSMQDPVRPEAVPGGGRF